MPAPTVTGGILAAGLVVAAALLASGRLARLTGVPYPVFLVLAGLLVGLLPGLPALHLDPQVVFYGFLPPLVYWAAFLASPGEFAARWRPISVLALALVLATTAAVAAVAHAVVAGLGWAPALVLGAIVAPTDPLAATAVLQRLGAPRQIVTILEGESLINDGVALSIYGIAVSATAGGGISVGAGVARFAAVVTGSLAVGLATGALARAGRRSLTDADAQIVLSLVTPYVAYIVADRLGASGVLATVAAGLLVGWRSPGVVSAATRLRANTFWEVLDYLLNAVLFVLLGAQFRSVLAGLAAYPAWSLAGDAAATVGTVAVVRMLWVLTLAPLGPAGPDRSVRRERVVIGWSGMRGAISLAAALAIPLQAGGRGFPDRPLLLFLTFCVVLATLVVQGASLPLLLRLLGVGGCAPEQEAAARTVLARAALERLDDLASASGEDPIPEAVLAPLRERYESRLAAGAHTEGARDVEASSTLAWWEALAAEREALGRLYAEGRVDADTMRRLQHELDLDEVRRRGRPR